MKTYLLTCAPNEDSNQPAHPRSLFKESLLSACRNFATLAIQKALSGESDQTAFSDVAAHIWCRHLGGMVADLEMVQGWGIS